MELKSIIQIIILVEFGLLLPVVLFFWKRNTTIKDAVINVENNSQGFAERDYGGYIEIQISEENKSLFCDLLKGFEEYATIKGYKISVSIDSSQQDKLYVKITVHDFGITADRKIIKKDLDEYVERVKNGDFDSIPEILDPIEHARLVMALKNRIVFLQQN